MLPMSVSFFTKKKQPKTPETQKAPAATVDPTVPIEDPHIRRTLHDFFTSTYWPYVRDIIIREIIAFQTNVDKNLQGALGDPRDTNGKMAAFFGGKIKAGDELKLIIERLKKNYSQ